MREAPSLRRYPVKAARGVRIGFLAWGTLIAAGLAGCSWVREPASLKALSKEQAAAVCAAVNFNTAKHTLLRADKPLEKRLETASMSFASEALFAKDAESLSPEDAEAVADYVRGQPRDEVLSMLKYCTTSGLRQVLALEKPQIDALLRDGREKAQGLLDAQNVGEAAPEEGASQEGETPASEGEAPPTEGPIAEQ